MIPKEEPKVNPYKEDKDGNKLPFITRPEYDGKYHTHRAPASSPVLHMNGDKGRTRQEFKKQCDVNEIVKQFMETGDPTPFIIDDQAPALPEEVTGLDYQDAMNQIAAANSMFEELPSALRNMFDNDPGKYVDYVTAVDANGNLTNLEEMYELGMAVKPTEEAPAPVVVTQPIPEASVAPPAVPDVNQAPNAAP